MPTSKIKTAVELVGGPLDGHLTDIFTHIHVYMKPILSHFGPSWYHVWEEERRTNGVRMFVYQGVYSVTEMR